jgi:hypothetical protein
MGVTRSGKCGRWVTGYLCNRYVKIIDVNTQMSEAERLHYTGSIRFPVPSFTAYTLMVAQNHDSAH